MGSRPKMEASSKSTVSQFHNSSPRPDSKEIFGTFFYMNAQQYWSQIPPTVNGMLGGMGHLNSRDIEGSRNLLRSLNLKNCNCALDCGAGIGRVSKYVLLPMFKCVDMVEQDLKFAAAIISFCSNRKGKATINLYPERIGKIYNTGLQSFLPPDKKYNVVWCQWVLGHLTETDLLKFFQRIRRSLLDDGYLIIKENINDESDELEKDEMDSSVTRPIKLYVRPLASAGFKLVKCILQEKVPKNLYPIYMFICQPNVNNSEQVPNAINETT